MQTLVFQLHGSMMAFGTSGGDKKRPTRTVPSRSGTLGLIMGALGVDPDDRETQADLMQSLSVSSVTLSSETVEDDYQTVQFPSDDTLSSRKKGVEHIQNHPNRHQKSTLVTHRSYAVDTYARIGVTRTAHLGPGLDTIQSALEDPTYLPYAGRKAYPLGLPMKPIVFDGLEESVFTEYPSDPLSERVIDTISGRTVLSTETPDEFDGDLDQRRVSDERVPGTRQFRERTEWFTEVDENVFQ